jgi:hypothetical protein
VSDLGCAKFAQVWGTAPFYVFWKPLTKREQTWGLRGQTWRKHK